MGAAEPVQFYKYTLFTVFLFLQVFTFFDAKGLKMAKTISFHS